MPYAEEDTHRQTYIVFINTHTQRQTYIHVYTPGNAATMPPEDSMRLRSCGSIGIHASHMRRRIHGICGGGYMPAVASGYMQRRRIHASHMRRRIHACGSIGIHAKEEDTCKSYEEEDTCLR